jgi:hypothetical protein
MANTAQGVKNAQAGQSLISAIQPRRRRRNSEGDTEAVSRAADREVEFTRMNCFLD